MAMREEIDAANRKAFDILDQGTATLTGFGPAGRTIPGMRDDLLLHAGPPIEYAEMIEPMRAAAQGAVLLEGKASTLEEADHKLRAREFTFRPCHEFGAVGPMAGITSASMYVAIVDNGRFPARSFCNLHEGRGAILRFGATGPEVLARLRWMNEVLGPTLHEVVRAAPLSLKQIAAEGVEMGDELHQRFRATSLLFLTRIAGPLLDQPHGREVFRFIAEREQFFLNLSMPMMKALADPADGIAHSTLVTRMTRNGVRFGIQVSGLPGRWFTGPAEVPKGLYFAGYSQADAASDFGDSAIMETGGLGGLASAAAPAVTRFVGGNARDAVRYTEDGYRITLGASRDFRIPALDFRGSPLGLDLLKVNETGVLPSINTGIAHRRAGIGQIGAGIAHPPIEAFREALRAFASAYGL
jgi:Protein of unknown function (DUF1116)